MALTKEQRQEYLNIIWDTGNYRETQLKKDWIPEDYLANKDLITREEVVVGAPWVEVPVKCYISTAKEKTEKCPIHVNMHGGGFVYPQDNDDDMYCAHVAAKIHGIVVDIDYACTTDYAFPVALDQCYGVMKWVYENAEAWGGDKEKVSMGGHSAGGCLAEALAFKVAKTNDFKVCLVVLDYAANDNYAPVTPDQFKTNTTQAQRSRAFSILYADGDIELLKDPYVSPFFATDDMLKNHPRTLFINAKNCPFCNVNEDLGMRLVKAGAEVTMKRFENSRHGFTTAVLDEWEEAQNIIIREILSSSKCID